MHRHPIACILLLAGCINATLVDSGDAGHSAAVAKRAAVAGTAPTCYLVKPTIVG